MKRIIASVLAAALLLLPLCSCSSVQHIEDTNGAEDTSLCTLTEEELVSPHPHYIMQGSKLNQKSGAISFATRKMSGVMTPDKFTVKAGETYEFTGGLHLWKRQMLLSIAGGTICCLSTLYSDNQKGCGH